MISETLAQIDVWFNEPTQGPMRPKLLAKLALLEFCGWLEVEMDNILMSLQAECLRDPSWVKSELIDKTSGFRYLNHFRPMVTRILGEYHVRKIEENMELLYPGEIERFISYTTDLSSARNSFAHADVNNNIVTQQTFRAPSWVTNQWRIISKILDHYKSVAIALTKTL